MQQRLRCGVSERLGSPGCGGHGPVGKGTWEKGGEGGVGMNENLAAGDDNLTRMG